MKPVMIATLCVILFTLTGCGGCPDPVNMLEHPELLEPADLSEYSKCAKVNWDDKSSFKCGLVGDAGNCMAKLAIKHKDVDLCDAFIREGQMGMEYISCIDMYTWTYPDENICYDKFELEEDRNFCLEQVNSTK